MSDFDPTPDDLIVSAVFDGVATADEIEQVASDPRLAARLAQFRAVAEAVSGPVPLVDTTVREAHLARAIEEGVAGWPSGAAAPPPPPPPAPLSPPPLPPPPAPVVDLAAARARAGTRRQPRAVAVLSVAAAVALLAAAGAFLLRAVDSGNSGGSDQAAVESTNDAGGDAQSFEPNADTGTAPETPEAATTGPPSTVAGDSSATAGGESGVDPALPNLGQFTKAEDLATRVRAQLLVDPNARDLATDETCQNDFGVPVTLLGRASLNGEEGLVYVEQAQVNGRRVWLVDPGASSATSSGAACRQITPVQHL